MKNIIPGHSSCKKKEMHKPSIHNVQALLKKSTAPRIFSLIKAISQTATQSGFKTYLVGGFVRDLLLNIKNIDVDLVVEGDGIAFAEKLAENLNAKLKSHKKFGTSVLVLPDGFKLDIATARTEHYKEPASLPLVKQSTLHQDLFRRDFTINALAIDLNQTQFGQLIDFFGGLRDIKQGLIKVLHNLSFMDDPTRAFRAVRFQHRLGFRIETNTLKMMSTAMKKGVFQKLSGSRLLNELKLLFEEKKASTSICLLAKLGLLKMIHSELKLSKKIEKNLVELDDTITWYRLLRRQKKVRNWLLYLMAIAEILSQKAKEELSQRLSIAGNAKDIMLNYKEQIDQILSPLALKNCTQPSDIYQLCHNYPLEILLYTMAGNRKEKVEKKISQYLTELVNVRLKITGEDIIKMGIKPGPAVGKILKQIHSAKLNGLVKTKKDEKAYARRIME